MMRRILRFWRAERGMAAVEFAVLLPLIAALLLVGAGVNRMQTVTTRIDRALAALGELYNAPPNLFYKEPPWSYFDRAREMVMTAPGDQFVLFFYLYAVRPNGSVWEYRYTDNLAEYLDKPELRQFLNGKPIVYVLSMTGWYTFSKKNPLPFLAGKVIKRTVNVLYDREDGDIK